MNTLDYEVSAKENPENTSLKKEYPNHTLKQNRSYQVGIVLVDRYGRSSDVILSSLDKSSSTALSDVVFTGSTVFHPFYSSDPGLINTGPSSTWNGDSLRVKFNSEIPLKIPQSGYPGLFLGYSDSDISNITGGGGYLSGTTNLATSGGSGTGLTVDITIDVSKLGGSPVLGIVQTVTINNPGSGYEQGDIITITGGSPSSQATFVYNPNAQPNLTGWYSYKIVVKQTEQDYYNVYLPGIVNGSLNTDGLDSTTDAAMSLFGDNVNKVPKDLTGVGPSQTNYNSTENLSLRVNNTTSFSSIQNYPGTDLEKVTQISELTDLGIDVGRRSLKQDGNELAGSNTFEFDTFNDKILPGAAILSVFEGSNERINSSEGYFVKSYFAKNPTGSIVILNKNAIPAIATNSTWTFGPPGVVFNSGNNPLIGILSTSKQIGVSEQDGFKTQLAVAETTPVESLLDIYYETTSSGSISVLNRAISDGIPVSVPVKTSNIVFNLSESQTGAVGCTNTFTLLDSANNSIIGANIEGEIVSVFDKNNNNRTSEFSISDDSNGTFSIATTNLPGKGYYIKQSENDTTFDFSLLMTNDTHQIPVEFTGSISNERPVYQGATGNDGNVTVIKTGGVFGNSGGGLLECLNGSGDTILNKKEIQWEIIEAIVGEGENLNQPDDVTGGGWQPAYFDLNPGATFENLPSYAIAKGQNKLDLFEFTDVITGQNFGQIRNIFATNVRFMGLQNVGAPSVGGTFVNNEFTTQSFTTAELIKFVDFKLKLRAVDRNGSGQTAEANGADPTVIEITVRVEN
jgi:hypothetical protein